MVTTFHIACLFLLYCWIPHIFANHLSHTSDHHGICGSTFIRNHPEDLRRLDGCKVIEGSLQIAMMEPMESPNEYLNYSFPLREITGYFLLYNVKGLLTLRHIFPNLTVIRGQEFVHNNYALLVMEMYNMQEIGLPSLVSVDKGRIWIRDNPNLCYLSTIDWSKISNTTRSEDIRKNKLNEQCPNTCPKECPITDQGKQWCWSNQDCQKVQIKVCPTDCHEQNCIDCCSDQCLGGCTGPGPEHCLVCKHVVYNGRCSSECPATTYKYLNRRCVTETECSNISVLDLTTNTHRSGKRLEESDDGRGQCVLECPKGYEEEKINGVVHCKPCRGHCKKVCLGKTVDSVDAALSMKGCTRIQGSLRIQIRGYTPQLARTLESSLDMIEEIDDYLAITNTYSLMSLDFFKSLKYINGNKPEENQYALIVRSNENIGSLWNHTVIIRNATARVRFHYNPKLCPALIRDFIRSAQIKVPTDERAYIGITNGDKVPCNQKKLVVEVEKKTNTSVTIRWENFLRNLTEPDDLLSYEISYREAPQNVSQYEERDPCGRDDWKVIDAPKMDDTSQNGPQWEVKLIPSLKHYTRYALYVKTVVIPDENSPNNNTGAESDLLYFVTLPGIPSNIENLQLSSNTTSEVVVSWSPPLQPNGELLEYRVYLRAREENINFQDQRDYCISGRAEKKGIETSSPTLAPPPQLFDNGQCCSCSAVGVDQRKSKDKLGDEVKAATEVLYAVLNKVFIANPDAEVHENGTVARKRKRSIQGSDLNLTSEEANSASDKEFPDNADQLSSQRIGLFVDKNAQLVKTVPAKNNSDPITIVLPNLTHFTEYFVAVIACRKESEEIENDTNRCSEYREESVYTQHSPTADLINPATISANATGSTIRLYWEEPQRPNGVVLAYQIHIRRVDSTKANEPTHMKCITRKAFQAAKNNFTFPESLHPGNYSYRIRTVSMATESDFTEEKFFVIPAGDGEISPMIISVSVVAAVLVFVILGISISMYIIKAKGLVIGPFITSANPYYSPNVDIDDSWEVPRDKIQVFYDKELGKGSFGMVYEGILNNFVVGNTKVKCAVKTVTDNTPSSERARFLEEAAIMSKMECCNHVVRLLGVVSKTQPTYVIMELMLKGDLKKYLKSRRPDAEENNALPPPNVRQILRMAAEIADGMAFLASHHFVHRDLAARNCMVAEDLTVKIGDFGMTKDVEETDYYRKSTKGLLPIRWMAPESINDGIFTHHSDIWSYGVVLWEMATLAAQPYQGLTNEQVMRFVTDGHVMEKPENCPGVLYDLMRLCWMKDPRSRPTFSEILDGIVEFLEPSFKMVSFYHSPKGIEYRALQQMRPAQDEIIDVRTPLRATCDSDDDLDDENDFATVDSDHVQSPYSDSENGTLLDKSCNGGPRVMYMTGRSSFANDAPLLPRTTTVNNNRVADTASNLLHLPEVISHSDTIIERFPYSLSEELNSTRDGGLIDGSNSYIRSNRGTSKTNSPPSATKVSFPNQDLTFSNLTIPIPYLYSLPTSSVDDVVGELIGVKVGNGVTGNESSTVSPTTHIGNNGTNGYLTRRSPVAETAASTKTTQF